MPLLCPWFGPRTGENVKEEDRLRAELAETKAKLKETQEHLNHLTNELKARLDQMSTGRRSTFEEHLLQWLRRKWSKSTPQWAFVHEENPVLNAERAAIVIEFLSMLEVRGTMGGSALEQYNKMRGALEIMLERLPPLAQDGTPLKP